MVPATSTADAFAAYRGTLAPGELLNCDQLYAIFKDTIANPYAYPSLFVEFATKPGKLVPVTKESMNLNGEQQDEIAPSEGRILRTIKIVELSAYSAYHVDNALVSGEDKLLNSGRLQKMYGFQRGANGQYDWNYYESGESPAALAAKHAKDAASLSFPGPSPFSVMIQHIANGVNNKDSKSQEGSENREFPQEIHDKILSYVLSEYKPQRFTLAGSDPGSSPTLQTRRCTVHPQNSYYQHRQGQFSVNKCYGNFKSRIPSIMLTTTHLMSQLSKSPQSFVQIKMFANDKTGPILNASKDMLILSSDCSEGWTPLILKDALVRAGALHQIKSIAVNISHFEFQNFILSFKEYNGLELVFIIFPEVLPIGMDNDSGPFSQHRRIWQYAYKGKETRISRGDDTMFTIIHPNDSHAKNFPILHYKNIPDEFQDFSDINHLSRRDANYKDFDTLKVLYNMMARRADDSNEWVAPQIRYVTELKCGGVISRKIGEQ